MTHMSLYHSLPIVLYMLYYDTVLLTPYFHMYPPPHMTHMYPPHLLLYYDTVLLTPYFHMYPPPHMTHMYPPHLLLY
jgi:hypothetical protein